MSDILMNIGGAVSFGLMTWAVFYLGKGRPIGQCPNWFLFGAWGAATCAILGAVLK